MWYTVFIATVWRHLPAWRPWLCQMPFLLALRRHTFGPPTASGCKEMIFIPVTRESALQFHCPRWEQLPAIPLYMDQVIIVLNEAVGLFGDEGGIITHTMINNYVKHRLIPPPERKKYGRQHLAALVVVSTLKRVLSMGEIAALSQLMTTEYGAQRAYDIFAEKLEEMLRAYFAGSAAAAAPPAGGVPVALDAALTSLMAKLYLQSYLASVAVPLPEKPPGRQGR